MPPTGPVSTGRTLCVLPFHGGWCSSLPSSVVVQSLPRARDRKWSESPLVCGVSPCCGSERAAAVLSQPGAELTASALLGHA